ncbi:MAG: Nif11 family protein [Rhodospirillaceae bacterium]|jgi:hypothetical protein|nr:Nif11 family protein [Rhodospirillaceae bacterium]
MSRAELQRFVTDAKADPALTAEARAVGETAEGLVAFARARGYAVDLKDLPPEARGQRGNAIAGPGSRQNSYNAVGDRWGFWGSRNAPRPLTTDRL